LWNNVGAYGISFGITAFNAFSLGTLSKNDRLVDRNLSGEISDAQFYAGVSVNTGAALASVAAGGYAAPAAGRLLVASGSPAAMFIGAGAAGGTASAAADIAVTRAGYAASGIGYENTVGRDLTTIGLSGLTGAGLGAVTYGTVRLGEGVIYHRTDINGLKGDYYGQAESPELYAARQVAEGKQFPDSIFSFEQVSGATPGRDLSFMEQFYIIANGGSKSQNALGTELSNWNRAMSDTRFDTYLRNNTALSGIAGGMIGTELGETVNGWLGGSTATSVLGKKP
jgi:hypothetical protein